jgi:aminopeptidase-like protein
MQIVSDIPTVFNFRRELIERSIQGQGAEQTAKMLGGEIKLTTKLIQSDPKSYTIWSYRQWLVRTLFAINP